MSDYSITKQIVQESLEKTINGSAEIKISQSFNETGINTQTLRNAFRENLINTAINIIRQNKPNLSQMELIQAATELGVTLELDDKTNFSAVLDRVFTVVSSLPGDPTTDDDA